MGGERVLICGVWGVGNRKYTAVLDRDTKNERKVNSERVFCGECSGE